MKESLSESSDLSEDREAQFLHQIRSAERSGMRAGAVVKAMIECNVDTEYVVRLIREGVINVTGTGIYYCRSRTKNRITS